MAARESIIRKWEMGSTLSAHKNIIASHASETWSFSPQLFGFNFSTRAPWKFPVLIMDAGTSGELTKRARQGGWQAKRAGLRAARVCDWVAPRIRAARRRLITTKEKARGGEEGLTWGVCNGYSTEAILSGFTCSGFNCVGLSKCGTFAMLLARWALFPVFATVLRIGAFHRWLLSSAKPIPQGCPSWLPSARLLPVPCPAIAHGRWRSATGNNFPAWPGASVATIQLFATKYRNLPVSAVAPAAPLWRGCGRVARYLHTYTSLVQSSTILPGLLSLLGRTCWL